MIRLGLLGLLAASLLFASTAVARNNANLSRREIRSMPILERPSRPGHFYGNAVRRNYYRSHEAGHAPSAAGVWEGYSQGPRYDAWAEESPTSSYGYEQ